MGELLYVHLHHAGGALVLRGWVWEVGKGHGRVGLGWVGLGWGGGWLLVDSFFLYYGKGVSVEVWIRFVGWHGTEVFGTCGVLV